MEKRCNKQFKKRKWNIAILTSGKLELKKIPSNERRVKSPIDKICN